MYEARAQPEILEELKAHSEVEQSKIEGTFEYDVLSSNSIEFAKTEIELEQVYKAAFADKSWGEYLTMRAAESGVIRKSAVNATGTLTVSGSGTLPAGSRFETAEGLGFETAEETQVTGTAYVYARAVEAGAAGNVAAGTITKIPLSIPGISSVTNAEAFHDGYDEEKDELLLERYLIHVRTPGTSGNVYHYLEWALSVPGVGGAKVLPTWDGPTTVKVIIVDSNYAEASEQLVQSCYEYIESVRPIGAVVTVASAVPKAINIAAASVTGQVDLAAFEKSVNAYFLELEKRNIHASDSQGVSLAQIGSILIREGGAEDYTGLTLNGSASNVALSVEDIAVLGTVSLS